MSDRSVLRGAGGLTTKKPIYATDSVEELEAARPTLVKRARKREVEQVDVNQWRIEGNKKLGDGHSTYYVSVDDGAWECSCYEGEHGDTRRRDVCSHVLGVWLYRAETPTVGEGDGPSRKPMRDRGRGMVVQESEPREDATEPAPPTPSRAASVGPPRASTPVALRSHIAVEKLLARPPLDPADPVLSPGSWQPPPFVAYREDQWYAAIEVVEQFINGARVVFVDAPTGAGKTGIADLVSRIMYQPAIYMCSTKSLQDQVLQTFEYAAVLKGRANYPTMMGEGDITCDDCDGTSLDSDDCSYCKPMSHCPYRRAKSRAIRAQLAVLNTAYWLREANFAKGFSVGPDPKNRNVPGTRKQLHGGLVVVDECDALKDALLGFIEFSLTKNRLRMLGLQAPKKGVHKTTAASWMVEDLIPALARESAKFAAFDDVVSQRRARALSALAKDAVLVAQDIPEDNWLRDNSREEFVPFSYKPVQVSPYSERYLWSHTGRTLMMSATIISPEEMAGTLGLEHPYATVRVPMRFPIENRPIIVAPIIEMKGGEKKGIAEGQWDIMARGIGKVLERHPGERVLVHTVSYGLAKFLMEKVDAHNRKKLTYTSAADREGVLARFRQVDGAVLFAPSFDRGIDLADDDCRVVIVAKIPYPNLGDPRVSALMHTPGGQESYTVEMIRTLVQMTGRGVRHMSDYCTSYILDAQFSRNVLKRHKMLLPEWWREALVTDFPTRQLL